MKGLLIKNVQLTVSNKRLILIVVGVAALMLVMGSGTTTFITGYVTLIFAFQVLTTITYDEYDHSSAFLMTMPITRSMYTIEKNVFALLSTAIGWAASMGGFSIYNAFAVPAVQWDEWLAGGFSVLMVALVLLAVSIPVQLKFGGENGRIVVAAIIVVCVILAFVTGKLLASINVDIDLLIESVFVTDRMLFWPCFAVIIAVLYLISMMFSMRIVKRKEY